MVAGGCEKLKCRPGTADTETQKITVASDERGENGGKRCPRWQFLPQPASISQIRPVIEYLYSYAVQKQYNPPDVFTFGHNITNLIGQPNIPFWSMACLQLLVGDHSSKTLEPTKSTSTSALAPQPQRGSLWVLPRCLSTQLRSKYNTSILASCW